jgi:hypothetical protein
VDPAEAFVGVETEHRAGSKEGGSLVLAVPVDRHRVRRIDLAAMHAVEHLKRMHDRATDEIIDLQAAASHLVDALDVVLSHLVEDVLGTPRALHLDGRGLRAAYLRHGHRADGCGASGKCTCFQESAAADRIGLSHSTSPP